MQHPPKVEHYKSDIEDQEYQIKRYQRFNLKPNRENVGSVSKSSHGVSEAIYLRDPDGNGIELYCDRPRTEWPYSDSGKLAMFTRPLDLDALLGLAEPP